MMGGLMAAAEDKVQKIADNTLARAVTRIASLLLVPTIVAFGTWIWSSNNRLGAVESKLVNIHQIQEINRASAADRFTTMVQRMDIVESQNRRDAEVTSEVRQSLARQGVALDYIAQAIRRLEQTIDQDRRPR